MAEVDLLALARSVEWSVPADLDGARRALQLLSRAVGSQQEQTRGFRSLSQPDRRDHADRLQALIARITQDVGGGHVVAVTGLERQVNHYLHTTRR